MRGRAVFYPMGWDDNGLPTERRVQNYFGVRCDPEPPLRPRLRAAGRARRRTRLHLPAQLRGPVPPADRRGRAGLRAPVAHARAVGRLVPHLRHHLRAGPAGLPAGLPPPGRPGPGRPARPPPPCGTSTSGPRCPRPSWRTASVPAPTTGSGSPGSTATGGVDIETTRPELLPACVALVAHPDDERYRPLFGTEVVTPLFGVRVPVAGPRAGRPREGVGHRHDLHLRRHHRRGLVARALPAHPDHRRPRRPAAAGRRGAADGWESDDPRRGRRRLRRAGRPHGQAGPDPHRRAAGRVGRADRRAHAPSPTRSSSTRRATGRSRSSRPASGSSGPSRCGTGCWPGARSCAGTRPTWPTATGPGWRASTATGTSAGSGSSACPSRSGTRSTPTGEIDFDRPHPGRRGPAARSTPPPTSPTGYTEDQRGQPGGFVGRPRRHGHLGHLVAHPPDRRRVGGRPRPVRPGLPHGPPAPGPRDHPHLAVLHRGPLRARARLPALVGRRHLRAGCSTPTARRCRSPRATWSPRSPCWRSTGPTPSATGRPAAGRAPTPPSTRAR